MRLMRYEEARDSLPIQPLDIVAYSGKARVSNIIKAVTRSNVSHVGIVDFIYTDDLTPKRVMVSESTSIGDGKGRVQLIRLSEQIKAYDGEVWILKLRQDVRERLSNRKSSEFTHEHLGKPYDFFQAAGSALEWVKNEPDYSRFFCSEWASGKLKYSGLNEISNPSEVTPDDMVQWCIYDEEKSVQVKGDSAVELLPRFNRMPLW